MWHKALQGGSSSKSRHVAAGKVLGKPGGPAFEVAGPSLLTKASSCFKLAQFLNNRLQYALEGSRFPGKQLSTACSDFWATLSSIQNLVQCLPGGCRPARGRGANLFACLRLSVKAQYATRA